MTSLLEKAHQMVTNESAGAGDQHPRSDSSQISHSMTAQRVPESGVFVILPTLNEVENIGRLLDEVHRNLGDQRHMICIIDDGSIDGTVDAVREAITSFPESVSLVQRKKDGIGCRRGAALRHGLRHAMRIEGYDVFVEMDGDLSHRPEELSTGISMVRDGSCNIAIASKYLIRSDVVERTSHRRALSRLSSVLSGIVIDRSIRDYSNGYRFYDRTAGEIAISHRLKYGTPIYLSEVLALWLRSGLKVAEFPSMYIGRQEGSSKLRLSDVMEAMYALVDIGWRYHISGFQPDATGGERLAGPRL